MEKKICIKCKNEKFIIDFYKDRTRNDGLNNKCKICSKLCSRNDKTTEAKKRWAEAKKRWAEANSDKIKENWKKHYVINKEKRIKRNVEYVKNRKLNDPLFKLKMNIKASIRDSLKRKNFKKIGKTLTILGCSIEEFKTYLESKFESWMNWENKGKYNGEKNYGWDIDHIIPISNAKTNDEAIKLNHYTNLQPLCSYINRDIKIDN